MGWGPGRSRSIDPKRHFQKPIPLSPLIKIDRERCILCYRCVRFSQEVAEDEQLQLLERGASTFVGTFDDRPYIAPFHGNIIELCPVGALTSEAYRFRARPWDIEDAGSVCTLCPSQCNVMLTVRDERIERVLARDNPEVDDGWLCDKGRFGYQMAESGRADHRAARPPGRRASPGELGGGARARPRRACARPASGRPRSSAAPPRTRRATWRSGSSAGRSARRTWSRARGGRSRGEPPSARRRRSRRSPSWRASVSDLDAAESILVIGCDPLHAMPILDLRIRKVVRRNGTRLAVATDRPSALDGGAEETARYAPGSAGGFLAALAAAARAPRATSERRASSAPTPSGSPGVLRPGSTVIVWAGEAGRTRLRRPAPRKLDGEAARGPRRRQRARPARGRVPPGRRARPLRGAAGARRGRDPRRPRRRRASTRRSSSTPTRSATSRTGPAWSEALGKAKFVLAVSMFEDASTKHADVVFPAESYAEKEGTVTHPDGRLQRLRPGVPHPGQRAADVAGAGRALRPARRRDRDRLRRPRRSTAIASEVPFYAGHHPRGDRRTRACAGRTATRPRSSREAGSRRRRPGDGRAECADRCRLDLRRPARARAAPGFTWAPTATCGRRR